MATLAAGEGLGMRLGWWGWVAVSSLFVAACGSGDTGMEMRAPSSTALQSQSTQVDIVGMTSALSAPAQRHMTRVQPANHGPVYLLAAQNDGYTDHEEGLLWYRSDAVRSS